LKSKESKSSEKGGEITRRLAGEGFPGVPRGHLPNGAFSHLTTVGKGLQGSHGAKANTTIDNDKTPNYGRPSGKAGKRNQPQPEKTLFDGGKKQKLTRATSRGEKEYSKAEKGECLLWTLVCA